MKIGFGAMLTLVFIFLCLWTNAHAGVTLSDIDITEEINTIEKTSLTKNDIELMSGIEFKPLVLLVYLVGLVTESATAIGLQEMRGALKLSTSPPWKDYNNTEPSEHELASTTTIEQYYNLKEPRAELRSLSSPFFYKENIDTAILVLDKRVPSIRAIFKKRFEQVPEVMDKTTVDNMIGVFNTTDSEVRSACTIMLLKSMICKKGGNGITSNASVPIKQTSRLPLPSFPITFL